MTDLDRSAGTIKVEGLRALRKELRAAGDDLSDLKEINKEAAAIVAKAADSTVPVRTGRLAASIRPAGTKTAGIVRAGKKSVPYANAVHWGRKVWPSQRSSSPTRGRFASEFPGRAFLSDAATSTQSQWVDLYSSRIDQILDTINGKA